MSQSFTFNRFYPRSISNAAMSLKRATFLLLLLGAGAGGVAFAAQDSAPAPSSPTVANQTSASTAKTAPVDHRLIKPGDRNCLRQTGSLIPPKKGDCLPVAGRSYGGDELRNTGAITNARALQMLDPSISLGH